MIEVIVCSPTPSAAFATSRIGGDRSGIDRVQRLAQLVFETVGAALPLCGITAWEALYAFEHAEPGRHSS